MSRGESRPKAPMPEKAPLPASADDQPLPPARDAKPGAPTAAAPSEAAAPQAETPAAPDQHAAEPAHPGVPLSPTGIVPESDVRLHSPAAATPPPERPRSDGLGDLPEGYGDGRLVALVRDPSTLFVYWDLSAQQLEQAFAGLGPARAALRLWNARHGGGELVREVEVQLEVRGWYLRDLPAGTELRVELWALGERGARLLRAARPVRLPPGLPSDQLEAFYVRLELDQPLPRDGIAGKRTLEYVGGPPMEWDRRLESRHLSESHPSSGSMPWSATLPNRPGSGSDEGQS
jgi:hypothetical protein